MEQVCLGATGLQVSRLGIGLAEIGFNIPVSQPARAASVLNRALDRGVTFLDTAACYGVSEELVGATVAHRRDEYALATKCGHVAGGYEGEPWTAPTISDSIDRSLMRLKTDRLDLVQLHTCEIEDLERGEVIRALQDARRQGKTRFIGYSGDNEAARWAVESGFFDTLQTSFNVTDQRARTRLFQSAKARGMGIIAKRPIANGAWGARSSPSTYAEEYFRRARLMLEENRPVPGALDDPVLLSLGFTLAHPEVDTAIVGTHNPDHMLANIMTVETKLPIPTEAVEELHHRFDALDDGWRQLS